MPWPSAVAEVVAMPGVGDHVAGDRVRPPGPLAAPCPAARGRLERLDRRRLGARDQLVDREVARRGLADEQRPRHVAAIAGDLGAEVEEQDRPVEDRPIAGRAVRQGRLRAGQAGDARTRAPRRRRSASATRGGARGRARSRRAGSRAAARRAPGRRPRRPRRPARARRAPSSPGRPPPSPRPGPARRPGAAAASRAQVACGTKPASTATRRAPIERDELRPARRAGRRRPSASRVVGRLAPGLDRVARVGEQHDLVAPDAGTCPTRRRPSPRRPRTRGRSGSACARAGRRSRHRCRRRRTARATGPGGPGRAARSASDQRRALRRRSARRREVGRDRPAPHGHDVPVLLEQLLELLALSLAKACLPPPSGIATK